MLFCFVFLSEKCVCLSVNYTTLAKLNVCKYKRRKLEMSAFQFRHCEDVHQDSVLFGLSC